MEWAVFVIIASAALVYAFMPLMRERQVWQEVPDSRNERVKSLEQEKASFLKALKDIEFEFASNKINNDDYEKLRNHYRLKVAEVMKQLGQEKEKQGGGESTDG
ncbi:MAG: hypothetical protein GXO94_09995 [Nitrospirae bacterium]|nr:hypothetical protein [Nitrospirota bacterium]